MEETMKNTVKEELEEQVPTEEEDDIADPLRDAIETQMKKIQRQSMLIGAQTMCRVVLEKIIAAESKPGKRTMNDYKRLIKDVKSFCEIGLSRKVNADGETETIEEDTTAEETVQN